MESGNIILHEADYQRLRSILARTQKDLRAHLVMLIDRSGHHIACEGPDQEIDQTALASLAAANVAAANALAQIVGEPGFSVLYHQGNQRSIHISDVANRFSLVLVFDQTVASGVVRWKVRRATFFLDEILSEMLTRSDPSASASAPGQGTTETAQFTDEEINRLVGEINLK
jgi:predicted regulator of Ras-like GTPase activity (Roadblock/LC7/MglB family)